MYLRYFEVSMSEKSLSEPFSAYNPTPSLQQVTNLEPGFNTIVGEAS